jgi:hypothetical protein
MEVMVAVQSGPLLHAFLLRTRTRTRTRAPGNCELRTANYSALSPLVLYRHRTKTKLRTEKKEEKYC